ncbi:MAG: dihydroneopterin aldolase [Candidatus Omnitrophota bacterium]
MLTTIRITDLKVKAIIGINPWERKIKQNILLNITLQYNASKAIKNDNIVEAIDYKTLTKHIIREVSTSRFFLLEKLAQFTLDIVLSDSRIKSASVRIDKPLALRFAKSVSAEVFGKR